MLITRRVNDRETGFLSGATDLPPWLVGRYVSDWAEHLGAQSCRIYLQDFDQRSLIPLTSEAVGEPATGALSIDGSVAGRAYTTSAPVLTELPDARLRLHLPLVTSGDRVGVLELTMADADGTQASEEVSGTWEEFAALVAALIVTRGQQTDVYFRARKRQDTTLPAEMQWHLLPPLSIVDPRFSASGILEPAYEVGGDSFDYAVNHELAHLAVFDAMGHGLDAAVMSGVAVAAYRHGRRAAVPVEDLYTLVDAAFLQQFGDGRFVTAQLANLHLPSGVLTLVNAGHPAALHLRGRRVLAQLASVSNLPIGLGGDRPEVDVVQLQPGDGLLFYTDGIPEARREDGETYGEERLFDDVERVLSGGLPTTEAARRLNTRLLEWRGGPPQDDATLLIAEWRGPDLY